MTQVRCDECGRRRDAYRPVRREIDGIIVWCCRQCWRTRHYEEFMYADLSDADRDALRKCR